MKRLALSIGFMVIHCFPGPSAKPVNGQSVAGFRAAGRRNTLVALAMALALLVGAPGRSAATYADFTPYEFGALDWPGGSAGLAGELEVGAMTGYSGLPIDGFPGGLSAGLLVFTTGSYTGPSWNFASGGAFSLAGGISALGIDPTTLLSGSFGPASIHLESSSGGNSFSYLVSGSFAGTIDPALALYYGLRSTSVAGYMSFSFLVDTPLNPDGFSLNSTHVAPGGNGNNSPAPIPAPPALLLFAPGLFGLLGIRKRLRGVMTQTENAPTGTARSGPDGPALPPP